MNYTLEKTEKLLMDLINPLAKNNFFKFIEKD